MAKAHGNVVSLWRIWWSVQDPFSEMPAPPAPPAPLPKLSGGRSSFGIGGTLVKSFLPPTCPTCPVCPICPVFGFLRQAWDMLWRVLGLKGAWYIMIRDSVVVPVSLDCLACLNCDSLD